MKETKTILLTFITGALFISCEKNITITQPAYQDKVSIQSMIEKDSLPIVYFNKTVPYFDKKVTFGQLVIRNARITLQSESGTDSLRLDSAFDRLYCEYIYYYKGYFPVQSNRAYTLTVKSGTDTYSASTRTDLLPPTIDSVGYTPTFSDIYGEHEGVIVYFKDVPSQRNTYRYEMVRYIDTSTLKATSGYASVCLASDSLLVHEIGRSVYSDEGLSGQQLKMVIEPAYLHKKGTKGLVYVQSTDTNAFNFYDQLDRQKQAQFNPFVEPVFLQKGQFGGNVIGYFSSKINSAPVPFVFPE